MFETTDAKRALEPGCQHPGTGLKSTEPCGSPMVNDFSGIALTQAHEKTAHAEMDMI